MRPKTIDVISGRLTSSGRVAMGIGEDIRGAGTKRDSSAGTGWPSEVGTSIIDDSAVYDQITRLQATGNAFVTCRKQLSVCYATEETSTDKMTGNLALQP